MELLEYKKDAIKELFTSSGQGQNPAGRLTMRIVRADENQRWTEILKMHVKLLCLHAPESVTAQIKQIIKDNFYPMEECLKIVEQYKQKEATALLNKKIGNNKKAITILM